MKLGSLLLTIALGSLGCSHGPARDATPVTPIGPGAPTAGSAGEPEPSGVPKTVPETVESTAPRVSNSDHTPQAEVAAQKNAEGEQQMKAKQYAKSSALFRDAAARGPEPIYFFNLCASLFQEGKFGESLTACNATLKHGPPPALETKTKQMMERIRLEAKHQGVTLSE